MAHVREIINREQDREFANGLIEQHNLRLGKISPAMGEKQV